MDQILNWLGTLPGALTQGLIWGIAAIGIYITFYLNFKPIFIINDFICSSRLSRNS